MAAGENYHPSSSYKLNLKTYAGIALVSAVYFADILLKASRKCFWFDELYTTYLCRLPDFKSTWAAVVHGADFNPPLLYLFTRVAQALFGEGLIATRLPAIIGVWLFGICLFLFVARRAGVVSGFIAGIFPFFTLAQYYSYEARAHGILLGWCGLSLVCWQRNAEGHSKNLWLVGFGLCLIGALLTHLYAVYILFPFVLVELYNLLCRRRPNWGIVAVLVLSLVSVVVCVYLPLVRAYRVVVPFVFFPASHDVAQRFLVAAIGPAVGVLLISLALFALEEIWHIPRVGTFEAISKREMLVAAGFACIPLVGLLGSKVSHGPFIQRYFLSSIAGYAIFLGFATSRREPSSWTTKALAGCMFLLMIYDLGSTVYLSMKNRIMLIEPSSGLALSTNPSNPMGPYQTLLLGNKDLDILVLPSLEYFYFFRYAPPSVVSHLYFGVPATSVNLGGYGRLMKEAHLDLKTTAVDTFLATHGRFLVYDNRTDVDLTAVQAIARAGYRLRSARDDVGGIMYEYER